MINSSSSARNLIYGQPVYLWLLFLVIAPNALMLVASFMMSSGGGIELHFNLSNYQRILDRSSYIIITIQTIGVALCSAVMSCLIAYPMAFFVSRRVRKGKIAFVLLVIIPLWISLLIRVFAWKVILGETGVLNSFLVHMSILSQPTQLLLYTRFTVLLTFTYVAVPYVFVTTFTALERIPNNLIEASRDSGASNLTTFRRVIWPLSRQGVAIGFALAFLLAVGDYISPSMVGGLNGTMVGMIIASQFGLAGNWPFGAALGIMLMFGVAVVLGALVLATRSRGVLETTAAATTDLSWQGTSWTERLGRALALVLFVSCYAVLYGPLLIIVIFSFNDSTFQALPLAGFTLQWYQALASDNGLLTALRRSLVIAALVSSSSAVIGTTFALILSRVRLPGGSWVELGMTLPVMLPGIVLGISLALTFHFYGLQSGYATVVLGQMTFVVPVVMVVVRSRLRTLDIALEQASADLGAGRFYTFRHVVLPLIMSAIVAGMLLGFTLSFDEVTVTLFLTGDDPTLPVYIWNQLRFGFTPTINAAFTVIGLASFTTVVVASRLIRSSKDPKSSSEPVAGIV